MTEIVAKYVNEYWIAIGAVILFFMDPSIARNLLAKVGIGGGTNAKKTPADFLDLVNELARANRDGQFGADEEIQSLYKKFSATPAQQVKK
jgi:hypothetical protein